MMTTSNVSSPSIIWKIDFEVEKDNFLKEAFIEVTSDLKIKFMYTFKEIP